MKLRKLTLALATTALLSTFAYAGNNMDEIQASFERDLNREATTTSTVTFAGADDPLVNKISVALYGASDPVLASFERDLYREATTAPTATFARADDPLVNKIDVALYGTSDPVLASFERDLYREPATFKTMLASGETDPLDVIYAVLRCEETDLVSKILKHNLNRCMPV